MRESSTKTPTPDTRTLWKNFGFRHFERHKPNDAQWIDAILLTMIDVIRDGVVRQRGLSWHDMIAADRRALYEHVVGRILANYGPTPGARNDNDSRPSVEIVVETLMLRDAELMG